MTISTPEKNPVHAQFDELKVGDHVEVERQVAAGHVDWPSKTRGTVVRIENCRQGLHFHRNFDDKVVSRAILLEMPDGELTSVAVDESTAIRHV